MRLAHFALHHWNYPHLMGWGNVQLEIFLALVDLSCCFGPEVIRLDPSISRCRALAYSPRSPPDGR